MKSWRTRLAAGLTVGAAAVTIPLTTGAAPASASSEARSTATATAIEVSSSPGPGWHKDASGWQTKKACQADGWAAIRDSGNPWKVFRCQPADDHSEWELWLHK